MKVNSIQALAIAKAIFVTQQITGHKKCFGMVGSPGTGKTEIAAEFSKSKNKTGQTLFDGFAHVVATETNGLELCGLFEIIDGKTVRAKSMVLPENKRICVLVDEPFDVPKYEQSSFYRLIREHKIGDTKLADGSFVLWCSNLIEHGAAAGKPSTAFINRGTYVELEQSADGWLKGFAYPKNVNPTVCGFVRNFPDSIAKFEAKELQNCTARSLTTLSDYENSGVFDMLDDASSIDAMVIGTIGENYGTRYIAFRGLDLPNVDEILSNPQTAELINDTQKLFALSALLVNRCNTGDDLKTILKYVKRVNNPVIELALIVDCVSRTRELMNAPIYTQCITEHIELAMLQD